MEEFAHVLIPRGNVTFSGDVTLSKSLCPGGYNHNGMTLPPIESQCFSFRIDLFSEGAWCQNR